MKMSGNQIIRTFASADIDFRCSSTDQITVGIERIQKARLIRAGIRLDSSQCLFVNEKRCFDGAIVSPKTHGAPGLVIRTTVIWKINHVIETGQIAGSCPL
ncbi:hypothetical protein GALL_437830 [mine drainage metagenome]|uniref:Uncharacterized protein n=1 Tax=mine drainage metagenome TaxID=410659 RepID=A0A1J5Q3T5_9ZZZZ